MGSCNVSCALSGLAIRYNDPCYYIPLKKSVGGSNIPASRYICSNETVRVFFEPATLPIFGKYTDYGQITIIEDSNTKAIERFVGTSVDNLVNGRKIVKMKFKGGFFRSLKEEEFELAGCYVHKFAYDVATKYMLQKNYGNSYYTHFPVGNKLLEATGLCSPIDKKEIDKRYHYMYRVNGEENYIIASDGEYSQICKLSDGVFQSADSIHSLKDLSKKWKECTGKIFDIPEHFKTKHSFDIKLDEFRDGLIRINKLKKEMEKHQKAGEKSEANIKHIVAELKMESISSRYAHFAFTDFYEPEILEKDNNIYKLFGEAYCLEIFMYLNSKVFMPNTLSPQEGDYDAELNLLKVSKKYIEQKMKREEKDIKRDDEED